MKHNPKSLGLLTIQLLLGYEWLTAGWKKVGNSEFASGISGTLEKFAGENPNGVYQSFLHGVAIPNSETLGHLVAWGELCTGITLVLGGIGMIVMQKKAHKRLARMMSVIGLGVGAFLNAHFYFAAGWMSASTAGLNALMFWVSVILFAVWTSLLCLTEFKPSRRS